MSKRLKSFISIVNDFNTSVAVTLTNILGNIWCVYIFIIWSLIPLVFPNLENSVAYVSADIIQLVALPALMVGADVLNKNSKKRNDLDHKMLREIYKDIKDIKNKLREKE